MLYNGSFGKSVQIADIDTEKPIIAQLKRLNGNKSFNHYSPANYMAKNIGTLSFGEDTIERFEKLFVMVNSKFERFAKISMVCANFLYSTAHPPEPAH